MLSSNFISLFSSYMYLYHFCLALVVFGVGHTAEGTLCFTSIDPTQAVATQVNGIQEEQTENHHLDPSLHAPLSDDILVPHDDEDEDDVRIVEKPSIAGTVGRRHVASLRDKRLTCSSSRNKDLASSSAKAEKAGQKRKQDGTVVEMMGKFLEMKEKQVAAEDAYPIEMCIAVVDGMKDLTDDEKVDAYDVFKDAQNREIFMTAKDSTCIKWLQKKIQS